LFGGAEIGDTGIWLGDYTVEAENGGLGVFAHEFGHDLGLPDYYDTAGGENGTAFWTLMSSGSWLGHGAEANEGIGTTPGLMGPEEKLFLGWLDHSEVDAGQSGSYTLNPAQLQERGKDQAVKINLPEKTVETDYTTPTSGSHAWWTGSADDLNETLTTSVPATSRVTVTANAWHQIEAGYDFLYAEYSTDGGANWQRVGNPVDGSSGGKWTTLRYSYDAGGAASMFRFRYQVACTCRARSSTTSASTASWTTSSPGRAAGRRPASGSSTTAR
jgi:immune inhibitor A